MLQSNTTHISPFVTPLQISELPLLNSGLLTLASSLVAVSSECMDFKYNNREADSGSIKGQAWSGKVRHRADFVFHQRKLS